MRIIFIILFSVVSVVHLTGCFLGKTRLADLTKPLLMPLLAFIEVAFLLPFLPGSQHVMLMLVLALAFCFLGDTMLLGTNDLSFTSGAGAFLIAHLFYINLFSQPMLHQQFSSVLLLGGAALSIILAAVSYILLGKPKAPVGGGIVIYAFVLFVLNLFTIAAFIKTPSVAAAAAAAGSLLFLLSDSILGYSVFRKDFKNSRFFIMLTYIPAQVLLTTGAVLPLLS